MSEILSQAEIEALLNSLGDTSGADMLGNSAISSQSRNVAPVSTGMGSGFSMNERIANRKAIAYEIYDFRRPDKFSKDQLRTLQMLHEQFARIGGSLLSAYLRAPVSMDLISIEQVPFEEYLRSIENSVFTILSMPPLTGQSVMEIEFGLVFTIIDRILGGPGRAISRQVLTDIERPLVRQIIDRMFQALKNSWEQIIILNPSVESMETSSQFVQIAPANDIVVTMLFEVKIANQRHAMSLCVPYLVLKPIAQKLSAQKYFNSSNRKQTNALRRHVSHQINRANVECTVRLGRARLTVRQFNALKPGDMIRLDQSTADDLTLLVGNRPKLLGRPEMSGRKVVFTITNPIPES